MATLKTPIELSPLRGHRVHYRLSLMLPDLPTPITYQVHDHERMHMLDLPITTKYMIMKGCLEKHHVLADLLNTTEPSASGYRTIILTLEERFGHGGVLLNHHLLRLTELPKVRETSVEDIELLIDTTRGIALMKADISPVVTAGRPVLQNPRVSSSLPKDT